MLTEQVCVAHVGGFLGETYINKGPFYHRFSLNQTWLGFAEHSPKIVEDV